MLNRNCLKALTFLWSVVAVSTLSFAAGFNSTGAHTWGIENSTLNIPAGSVITGAKLTVHSAAFDPASTIQTATIRILNNPDLGVTSYTDGQAGDYFAPNGALLADLKKGSLTTSPQNVVIDISQKNDPAAPILKNFGQPFEVTLGDGSKVSYSSAMIALLDYAGSGRSFGFGVDCDGFTFSDLSLELTVASMTTAGPAQTIRLSASNNTPPVFDAIADQALRVGQPLQLKLSASDSEGDALTYSASGLPAGAMLTGGIVSWTPAAGQEGTYQVTFTVSDGSATDTKVVNFTVTSDTVPVEIIIDNRDSEVSMVGTWPVSGGVNAYGTDAVYNRDLPNSFSFLFTAPETGYYEVSMWWTEFSSRSAVTPVEIEHAAGTASITVNQQTNGGTWNTLGTYQYKAGTTYKVTLLTLADRSSICADAVRFVKTAAPQLPAEVIIDNRDAAVSMVGTWPVSGGVNPYGTDAVYNRDLPNSFSFLFTAPDTASYEVSMWWTEFSSRSTVTPVKVEHAAGIASMTVNQQTNGGKWNTLGTYQYTAGTTYKVTLLTLADRSSICADAVRFVKTQEPPAGSNNPPVLSPIGAKAVQANSTLTITPSASDPDGDTVTYSASNLPQGAVFNGTTFTWTPAQAGQYTVVFSASDGQLSDSEEVTITVTAAANKSPVISPIADQTVTVPNTLSFTVQASDPDGDSVTVSAQNLPAGATFSNKVFSWMPTAAQAGTYNVTLNASDGKGGTDSVIVRITVQAAAQWVQLTYDDFESGWGSYTDGGADCALYRQTKYAHQGSNAVNIQDDTGTASSFSLTNGINVTNYSQIKVEFWYIPVSMDVSGDTFRLDYWDGSQWRLVKRWANLSDFRNFTYYFETVTIEKTSFNFSSAMKIRFVCEADDDTDDLMIDEIRISAK